MSLLDSMIGELDAGATPGTIVATNRNALKHVVMEDLRVLPKDKESVCAIAERSTFQFLLQRWFDNKKPTCPDNLLDLMLLLNAREANLTAKQRKALLALSKGPKVRKCNRGNQPQEEQ